MRLAKKRGDRPRQNWYVFFTTFGADALAPCEYVVTKRARIALEMFKRPRSPLSLPILALRVSPRFHQFDNVKDMIASPSCVVLIASLLLPLGVSFRQAPKSQEFGSTTPTGGYGMWMPQRRQRQGVHLLLKMASTSGDDAKLPFLWSLIEGKPACHAAPVQLHHTTISTALPTQSHFQNPYLSGSSSSFSQAQPAPLRCLRIALSSESENCAKIPAQ
ncbi:hypothetical protein BDK51DRAFT_50836 [Blyttiomyces helicus]|uniref:Uncharacterized protein n=1 Tax=Blyttiomyces helicus TaxID=388810 RepID=A0A4P9WQX5_9FUNG|nr:hypothetical protein BDK51DRAFT_50836 [Blyttiomyces helicus]|eukprot:RKO93286.1 hypothetical protein BDK51DRAFT_50836 [Blyttiomyces helicus]